MPRFDTTFNFGAAATPTGSKPPPGQQPGEARTASSQAGTP
jgi:hypothetical protein